MSLELFDTRGRFIKPTPEQIAQLPEQVRELVQHIADAATALEAATAIREAADFALSDALARQQAAIKARPKITHTDIAREWIASERAQITR